jgi:hypothetical protein
LALPAPPMPAQIVYVPILHGSLPFALAVREAFFRERPDCVAVELPETLAAPVDRAIRRLPVMSVIRYARDGGWPAFVLVEPCDGIFEALRLAREHGIASHLVDRDSDDYPDHHDALPDPYAAERLGCETYVREAASALESAPRAAEDDPREATMAFHLSRLGRDHEKILFVCGIAHAARVRQKHAFAVARPLGRTKRSNVEVLNLHVDSTREVLSEPAFVQSRFESWRRDHPDGIPPAAQTDRYVVMRELLLSARARMLREDGEKVDARSLRIAMQFARNQALVRAALAPDLYDLTTAARGVASDDFAWHVWDLGVTYAEQTDPRDLPTYRLTIEEMDRSSRRVLFRRRLRTRRHVLRLVRTRPKEPSPGAWPPAEDGQYLCSYPPEDVEIEAYGAYLRKRAKGLLAAERARVAPFTSGFGDGIDLRETIRNMLHDGRIFIREEQAAPLDVGAICMIFDAEDREDRYSWTITWQGEHSEESDMALYATPPGSHVVGPKIGRSEYGGFLMTYPPGRMFRVFEDSYFDVAENKAERLLYAAIDYCIDRSVVYVAAKPPRAKIVQFARRAGKKVVYVPIGQLSPAKIRRLRVLHVLDGRAVRGYAGRYINVSRSG